MSVVGIIQDTKPPYVQFVKVPMEDRAASEEKGRRIVKDVDFAHIMQPGSRDTVEKVATEWLADIKKKSLNNQYPENWVEHFEKMYDSWKNGEGVGIVGTPLKEWGLISPAEIENFKGIKVFSVEDLANLSEEGITRSGMGSRRLKDKAKAYLEAAEDTGKAAETIASLRAEVKNQKTSITSLENKIAKLEAGKKPKKGK